MTASPRTAALLSVLLLAAAPLHVNVAHAADAAEQVRWPVGWKAGEATTYDTESVVRARSRAPCASRS